MNRLPTFDIACSRTKSDSGKRLTDQEILRQIKVGDGEYILGWWNKNYFFQLLNWIFLCSRTRFVYIFLPTRLLSFTLPAALLFIPRTHSSSKLSWYSIPHHCCSAGEELGHGGWDGLADCWGTTASVNQPPQSTDYEVNIQPDV